MLLLRSIFAQIKQRKRGQGYVWWQMVCKRLLSFQWLKFWVISMTQFRVISFIKGEKFLSRLYSSMVKKSSSVSSTLLKKHLRCPHLLNTSVACLSCVQFPYCNTYKANCSRESIRLALCFDTTCGCFRPSKIKFNFWRVLRDDWRQFKVCYFGFIRSFM